MNTEHPSDGPSPSSGPKSAAERMRAYRRRRRRGVRCYEVQLGRAELSGLVAKGYLPSDKRDNRQAIELAIDDLLFDAATVNVRFWHKADVARLSSDVRFRG